MPSSSVGRQKPYAAKGGAVLSVLFLVLVSFATAQVTSGPNVGRPVLLHSGRLPAR